MDRVLLNELGFNNRNEALSFLKKLWNQDILDSLVKKYESHIKELTNMLQEAMSDTNSMRSFSWDWLREYYFEQYLFDTFCNQMMRYACLCTFDSEQDTASSSILRLIRHCK